MVSFKEYLAEAEYETTSRTRQVTVEELTEWADKHAKNYLSGTTGFLYRGVYDAKAPRMGDSNVGEDRKSANTRNYYTWWIDNHPSFKGWPKRSKSWVTSTNATWAKRFGKLSIVIPADNAPAGMCGAKDLWQINLKLGFDFGAGPVDIAGFSSYVVGTLGGYLDIKAPASYNELVTTLKQITLKKLEERMEQPFEYENWKKSLGLIIEHIKKQKCSDAYELFEKTINPSIFKGHVEAGSLTQKKGAGEVWIQGEAAFMPLAGGKKADKEKFLNWAKQYPAFYEAVK